MHKLINHQNFQLIAFWVSATLSMELIGCAVYLRHEGTGRIGLVLSRNYVVDQDRGRTKPCLEVAAIHFGVETVMDLYSHLSSAVIPINIKFIHASIRIVI